MSDVLGDITEKERLAVLEQQMESVCDRLLVIDQKLDAALVTKADKSELKELRDSIASIKNQWPIGATIAISVLGTIMGVALGVAGATMAYATELRTLLIAVERLAAK